MAILPGIGQSRGDGGTGLGSEAVGAREACFAGDSVNSQAEGTGGREMLSQVTQPLAPLLAFGSENAEFPAQGVEADVIGKVSTCFETSKCVQSSPTKANKQKNPE